MDELNTEGSGKERVEKIVDLEKLIRSKSERALKLIPGFFIRYIKRIIHQDRLNNFLEYHKNDYGLDFVNAGIEEIKIKIKVHGKENIPPTGRYIVAANHPLGGPEGLALMSVIGLVRTDLKFIVNDLLLNIKNFEGLFIPVNKHGYNTRQNLIIIEDAYNSDQILLNFPFGLVSRKHRGKIMDLEWKKSFIVKAKKHKRDIIPVYIDGRNSNFFYRLSNIRKFFGIKANIEMLYLVNEMYKQKDKTLNIIFGESIPYETFDKTKTDKEWAEIVRQHTYALGGDESLPLKTRKITSGINN